MLRRGLTLHLRLLDDVLPMHPLGYHWSSGRRTPKLAFDFNPLRFLSGCTMTYAAFYCRSPAFSQLVGQTRWLKASTHKSVAGPCWAHDVCPHLCCPAPQLILSGSGGTYGRRSPLRHRSLRHRWRRRCCQPGTASAFLHFCRQGSALQRITWHNLTKP